MEYRQDNIIVLSALRMLALVVLATTSLADAIVVTTNGTPQVVNSPAPTNATISNWSLNGGNAVVVFFSGENVNTGATDALSATYAGQVMTVIQDTSGLRWDAAIAYIIDPVASTGDIELSWAVTSGAECLYTPMSLDNVGSVVTNNATDTGNMTLSYTTTLDGGFVVGVACNNDYNGPPGMPTVSGNPDTFLFNDSASGNFGTIHVYGDVATAGSYTDDYGSANSVASVAFEWEGPPAGTVLVIR